MTIDLSELTGYAEELTSFSTPTESICNVLFTQYDSYIKSLDVKMSAVNGLKSRISSAMGKVSTDELLTSNTGVSGLSFPSWDTLGDGMNTPMTEAPSCPDIGQFIPSLDISSFTDSLSSLGDMLPKSDLNKVLSKFAGLVKDGLGTVLGTSQKLIDAISGYNNKLSELGVLTDIDALKKLENCLMEMCGRPESDFYYSGTTTRASSYFQQNLGLDSENKVLISSVSSVDNVKANAAQSLYDNYVSTYTNKLPSTDYLGNKISL